MVTKKAWPLHFYSVSPSHRLYLFVNQLEIINVPLVNIYKLWTITIFNG